MNETIIIKLGQRGAVESAIKGLTVLWVRNLENGYIAAAVCHTPNPQQATSQNSK